MHGAIPPLPNAPSWHGGQLKKKGQGQLYLAFTLKLKDNMSLPEFYFVLVFGTDASVWHQLALC
jgi:hypothetical protein